jgi:hypothetical protein
MRNTLCGITTIGLLAILSAPMHAQVFNFSTGAVTNSIATGSRPGGNGKSEIESADDFLLNAPLTSITSATFTGLLPSGANITDVHLEIYRVFPFDSDAVRTPNVPTRNNSPSDVAFAERDSTAGGLTFTTTTLNPNFTALNSVLNGINPKPTQTTMGEGPVSGQEVQFNVNLAGNPLVLPGDHYFFVPQVQLANGDFMWLSGTRPLVAPGTPFAPDLQSWIRNENLAPDWLRIGTDIVGGNPAPQFNGAFSLSGQAVPEPGPVALFAGASMSGVAFLLKRRGRGR